MVAGCLADAIDVISGFSPLTPLLICHFLFQLAACKREVHVRLLFSWLRKEHTHPVSVALFWSTKCSHRFLSVIAVYTTEEPLNLLKDFATFKTVWTQKVSSHCPFLVFRHWHNTNNAHVPVCKLHSASGSDICFTHPFIGQLHGVYTQWLEFYKVLAVMLGDCS